MPNQIGMPPAPRHIQRRRHAEVDSETEEQASPTGAGNQALVSIIAFVSVLLLGLVLVWLAF